MATLTVSTTTDFSEQILLNVTLIDFTNASLASSVTATFSAIQFDDVHIKRDVQIDGSAGFNVIAVSGQNINASQWTFSNWSSRDTVTLTGTSADKITGSVKADTINAGALNDLISGGLGADVLDGGTGNDTFTYRKVLDMASGEKIAGGGGSLDTILLQGAGFYGLSLVELSGVEQLSFDTTAQVTFGAGQIGKGGITLIDGNEDVNSLVVSGSLINLTLTSFSDWSDGTDFITLAGKANTANKIAGSNQAETILGGDLDDLITGRGGNDTITGGLGSDTMNGGDGDDVFLVRLVDIDEFNELTDSFNGGSGFDTLKFTGSSQFSPDLHFQDLTFTGIEKIIAANYGGGFKFASHQIGSGPGQLSEIDLGSSLIGDIFDIQIYGGDTDLTGVAIDENFLVFVYGDGNDNAIAGSSISDDVLAASGDDIVNGGGGNDGFYGGNGDDVLDGGNGSDFVLGESGQDILTGGQGEDYFEFEEVSDSSVGGQRDRITDFEQGIDIVRVNGIDAIPGGVDSAFTFLGTDFFDGELGRLRYFQNAAGNTIIAGDIDGNAEADFQIQINGLFVLTEDDFEIL